MKKIIQTHRNKFLIFFALFAVLFFVGYFLFSVDKTPKFFGVLTGEDGPFVNEKGQSWGPLPRGLYAFGIASGQEANIKFLKGEIDPPDVHIGDVQKFMIEATAVGGIKSIIAHIETDNGTTTVSLAQTEGNIWRGEWIVKDTHNTRYITKFIATDNDGNSDSFELAWSDLCSIGLSGNWSVQTNNGGASCTIGAGIVEGVDNGNIAIDAGTLTVNGTFVFNSGKSITISGAGNIVMGSGGQIKQSDLYMTDTDSDGYPSNSTQSLSSGAGLRRKSALTSFNLDCNDSSGTIWQNLTGYADADSDGYNTPSGSSICSGASLPPARVNAGSDCNDGNASIWQTFYGYRDNDGDGVVGSDYTSQCGGASNPLYGSPGSDCNDSNVSYSYYGTVYYDGDQDGYGSWSTSLCANGGAYYPYTVNPNDCNDSSGSIYPGTTQYQGCTVYNECSNSCSGSQSNTCQYNGTYTSWSGCGGCTPAACCTNGYYDNDGDGYGAGAYGCYGSGTIVGYGTDCNDNNVNISPGATEICANGTDENCDSNDPLCADGCTQTTECILQNQYVGYQCSGFLSGYSKSCWLKNSVPPGGQCESFEPNYPPFSNSNTHTTGCNSPNIISQTYLRPNGTACWYDNTCQSGYCYADADGDGYKDGTEGGYRVCKASASSGIDCNESNASVWRTVAGYLDADGDGYGTGAYTTCAGSGSYVANNTDCYDSNALARPGYAGYQYVHRGDGSFDWNCDGQIGKYLFGSVAYCSSVSSGAPYIINGGCSSWGSVYCTSANSVPYNWTSLACGSSAPGPVTYTGADWPGPSMSVFGDSGCSTNFLGYAVSQYSQQACQ